MFKRSIEGGFCIVWKTTSGKLPRSDVIRKTLTADPLVGTRFIGAVAYI
jgi:hypothetical protein